MKRIHLLFKPAKTSDLSFGDFYDEVSHDWQHRATQLQLRRWRALKREVKGGHYATH